MSEQVQVGDKVRSFDFADPRHPEWGRDLEGERAAYVEGLVVAVLPAGAEFAVERGKVACFPDCDRYAIKVETRVWSGKREAPREAETWVFPPVNGTPASFGGEMNGVEVIS